MEKDGAGLRDVLYMYVQYMYCTGGGVLARRDGGSRGLALMGLVRGTCGMNEAIKGIIDWILNRSSHDGPSS